MFILPLKQMVRVDSQMSSLTEKTFNVLTFIVYQRSKPLHFFVNVNQFIKIVHFIPFCRAIHLSSRQCFAGFQLTLKHSIFDVQMCSNDQLRQKLKALR